MEKTQVAVSRWYAVDHKKKRILMKGHARKMDAEAAFVGAAGIQGFGILKDEEAFEKYKRVIPKGKDARGGAGRDQGRKKRDTPQPMPVRISKADRDRLMGKVVIAKRTKNRVTMDSYISDIVLNAVDFESLHLEDVDPKWTAVRISANANVALNKAVTKLKDTYEGKKPHKGNVLQALIRLHLQGDEDD